MSRGIVDLIHENKKRFYAGEIRNCFYDEPYASRGKRQRVIVVDNSEEENEQGSLWQNLKNFGQRISEDIFYEPAK